MMKIIKITRDIAEKRLNDVPADKVFWSCDNRVLKNLYDLEMALNEMNEETYLYHANESKNDFGNWVRDVLGDDKLSRDLFKSKNKLQAAKNVGNRIALLKTKIV